MYNTNQKIHLRYTDEKKYFKINIYKITLKLSEYKWNLDDSKIDMGWYQKNVDSTSIPVIAINFWYCILQYFWQVQITFLFIWKSHVLLLKIIFSQKINSSVILSKLFVTGSKYQRRANSLIIQFKSRARFDIRILKERYSDSLDTNNVQFGI